MPQASLNALIEAYQAQIEWLLRQAEEFEKADRRIMANLRGKEIDLSTNFAAEYRHKAGNMQSILQAYDRLHAKEAHLKLA